MAKFHPRIRLRDKTPYETVGQPTHVWFVVDRRWRPVFKDPKAAQLAVDVLKEQADYTGVQIYMYCVMPDHVHLVLSPSATCVIKDFVSRYKNFTRRALKDAGILGLSWQDRFGDRVIRSNEDLQTVCNYVLLNAVKDGLAMDWREYPFCGSLVFDLE